MLYYIFYLYLYFFYLYILSLKLKHKIVKRTLISYCCIKVSYIMKMGTVVEQIPFLSIYLYYNKEIKRINDLVIRTSLTKKSIYTNIFTTLSVEIK